MVASERIVPNRRVVAGDWKMSQGYSLTLSLSLYLSLAGWHANTNSQHRDTERTTGLMWVFSWYFLNWNLALAYAHKIGSLTDRLLIFESGDHHHVRVRPSHVSCVVCVRWTTIKFRCQEREKNEKYFHSPDLTVEYHISNQTNAILFYWYVVYMTPFNGILEYHKPQRNK